MTRENYVKMCMNGPTSKIGKPQEWLPIEEQPLSPAQKQPVHQPQSTSATLGDLSGLSDFG